MADYPYAAAVSAAPWIAPDNGLLAANGDPWLVQSTGAVTAGTVYLSKIPVRSAFTWTNLWFGVATAGSGASTGSFAGLYSSAGTLLTTSADIGGSLTAIGTPSIALTTPQTLVAGTFVWAALVINLATTQPSLRTASSSAGFPEINLTAALYRFAQNGTSQTTLPASITPSANASSPTTWWVGAN